MGRFLKEFCEDMKGDPDVKIVIKYGVKATSFLKRHLNLLLYAVIGIVAVASFYCVYLGYAEWRVGRTALDGKPGNLDQLASLGSYLQGATGSLWSLAGFFIIFVAFLIQALQLTEQRKQNERENFDSRFFEMVGIHRQNISELSIGTEITGRRVFVSLIREFRDTIKIVSETCAEVAPDYPLASRRDLAYLAFYYGVGPNSTRILKDDTDHHPLVLVDAVVKKLESIQRSYRTYSKQIADRSTPKIEIQMWIAERAKLTRVSYCPFDGHQSRLGHYFRHLFEVVKYIDRQAPKGTAYEYGSIIRAQLTNHEQAILCLNGLATIGAPWITRGYFDKYLLIRNIPQSFFEKSTELDLEKEFPKIHFEFMKSKDSEAEPNR